MARPRVRLSGPAKPGDIVEVRTLIDHPMESGQRKSETGAVIPRKNINRFECVYLGEPAFVADLQPSVSADPYIVFHLRARSSGKVEFRWTDDDGTVYRDEATLTVA